MLMANFVLNLKIAFAGKKKKKKKLWESVILQEHKDWSPNRKYKKVSLSNSNNWFPGDRIRRFEREQWSSDEAFPGLSGFERIMFKPCKDKSGLHRLWAGPLTISIWQSPLPRPDLPGAPESADVKKPALLCLLLGDEAAERAFENAFCGGNSLHEKEARDITVFKTKLFLKIDF